MAPPEDDFAEPRGSGVEVMPAMVHAASDVLRESGLLEYYPDGAAELIVAEMLRAALLERDKETGSECTRRSS